MSKAARSYTTLLGLDKYVQFYSEIYPQQTVEVVVNLVQFWSNNFYHILFCSGRHTFGQINTRRGYNFQPALSQTQKIKTKLTDLEAILEILES
jgi:hypothetical protein